MVCRAIANVKWMVEVKGQQGMIFHVKIRMNNVTEVTGQLCRFTTEVGAGKRGSEMCI
jgi:hypothetical protein